MKAAKNQIFNSFEYTQKNFMNSWIVYIIETKNGKFYTGITIDLRRRFNEHHKYSQGAKFFRLSEPQKVVFQERKKNRSLATKREIAIKRMSRKEKLRLIEIYEKNLSILK